jgi:hypothetical protein
LLAALALGACERQTASDSAGEPATSAGVPSVYAVFAEHEMSIERLEAPVPLAMTAGSVWSLVTSSSPDVVSIEAGSLVAHKNGRAELRSATDQRPLLVTVRAAGSLRIDTEDLVLLPGDVHPVRVLADGVPVVETAVRWSFSDPEIAVVEGSRVRAGYKPGRARLSASYGGMESSIDVMVERLGTHFRVIARQTRLRLGSVEQLIAEVPAEAQVLWSSSDEHVLKALRGGLFQGRAKGSAKACAEVAGRRTCVPMSVL